LKGSLSTGPHDKSVEPGHKNLSRCRANACGRFDYHRTLNELVCGGEGLGLTIGVRVATKRPKGAESGKRGELRDCKLALVHCGVLRANAKGRKRWDRSASRDLI